MRWKFWRTETVEMGMTAEEWEELTQEPTDHSERDKHSKRPSGPKRGKRLVWQSRPGAQVRAENGLPPRETP